MDFESLLKRLQDWTNKIPLVILGSGASVPFNLPSMYTLGEHLKNSISFSNSEDQKQFNLFKTKLNKSKDLEVALQELNIRPKVLNEIIFKTWQLVNKHDLEAYEHFINSKVEFPLAELTKYLIYPVDKKLSIITTNYDRLGRICSQYCWSFYM